VRTDLPRSIRLTLKDVESFLTDNLKDASVCVSNRQSPSELDACTVARYRNIVDCWRVVTNGLSVMPVVRRLVLLGVARVTEPLAKLSAGTAHPAGEFRKFLRPEEQQHHGEDDEKLGRTDVHHTSRDDPTNSLGSVEPIPIIAPVDSPVDSLRRPRALSSVHLISLSVSRADLNLHPLTDESLKLSGSTDTSVALADIPKRECAGRLRPAG
jgi:hypothetical protein